MHSFLKEYGVGIVTLVFITILIAMASPFGIRIREYLLPQLEYASTIGSEEMAKATGRDTSDDEVAAMSSIYACLYTDGELVLSGTPIDNTGRTDVDTDFGEVVLQDVDVKDETTYPQWLSPFLAEMYGRSYVDTHTENIKTVNIINKIKPTTCEYWFYTCTNLTEIKNIQNLNTGECTDMQLMFCGCENLSNLDVSKWDTSNVTDMFQMFGGCISLISLDVSNWNTSNVTNMNRMLINCESNMIIKGHDLSGLDEDEKNRYIINHNIFDMSSIQNNNDNIFGALA